MSGDFSDRHPPRPKARIPIGPVPRPKIPIGNSPVSRSKQILPGASVTNPVAERANSGLAGTAPADGGNATIEEIMRIRRRSVAGIGAELVGLGIKLNKVRKKLKDANDDLRIAREVLERRRAEAPLPFIPVPSTDREFGKKRNLRRRAIPPLIDIILSKDNLDARDKHAAAVAEQEQIVMEHERAVRKLELADREILAQIRDKVREREELESNN